MPLRDDLLQPIPGGNPSGANLRYDPLYDKIKEARRRDDDAPQGDWQRERKAADFKLVIKLAGDALGTRTKDVQLAVWLTEALLQQEGFSGLRQGLDLLRGLLENFWDTVYPEVEDGDVELRAAPLEWAGTRLEDAVKQVPLTRGGLSYFKFKESRTVPSEEDAAQNEQKRAQREAAVADGKVPAEQFDKEVADTPTASYEAWVAALEGCRESVEALGSLCDAKFGGAAPSFTPLKEALELVHHAANQFLQRKLEQEGRKPAPQEEPEAAAEESSTSVAESSAAAPARRRAAAVVGLDPVDLDEVTARLAAVARFLRQQDAYSPAPYLLLRGYRWGELRGYGESPDPALLVPPASEARQSIKKLSLEGNWGELLEAAESAMAQPCGRAWLDLQRYVVRAANESSYTAIAQAVTGELRALLTERPQILEWTLMDDTPTANAETRAWIRDAVMAPAAGGRETSVAPFEEAESEAVRPSGEPAPPDTFTLALEAARGGRSDEAIQLLANEIPQQRSGRARFQRKLQLAQICMITKHEALARPILEELAASIHEHRLEDWEAAETISQPLAMLYRCLDKLDGDPAVKQKLYAQISRLDPIQALECVR
jgi:type VI secretion system protein ImpA